MRIKLWAAFAACAFFLVGCDAINGFMTYGTVTPNALPSQTGPAPTMTSDPNATLAPGEYRTVSGQTCTVATITSLQTDNSQTGLIAWNPASSVLAFVAPLNDQLWYSGSLTIATGSGFATQTPLTKDLQVTGDLLWSPDGTMVAFDAYRQEDSVYTVMIAHLDGKTTDLFPGQTAITDSFSSPKKLLRWTNNSHLQVGETCGVDCEQQADVNVQDGTVTVTEQPVRKGTLIPAAQATNQPTVDPTQVFPEMTMPVWSPDGSQVVYLDYAGNPWILSVKGRSEYPLNINNDEVMEMKWSPDGKLLAIRTYGLVLVFQLNCQQQG